MVRRSKTGVQDFAASMRIVQSGCYLFDEIGQFHIMAARGDEQKPVLLRNGSCHFCQFPVSAAAAGNILARFHESGRVGDDDVMFLSGCVATF